MENYNLAHLDFSATRTELHDMLNLTGAEISLNNLPAGVSVPFVHTHTQNEEIYIVLEGAGKLYIDNRELPLKAGDCFRIDPAGARCICAGKESAIRFLCVQVKKGSLEGFTVQDAIISTEKPSWL